MARWEDNIFGRVTKEDWLTVGAQIPTRQNDPIDSLFGDDKTDNLVAAWESIAAEYSIPVMAQFHGFDTESLKTFRIPIDTHNIEKGLIKVKINQSERLRALTRAGVQGDQRLYDYVLQDGIRLADQVITRTKVAKNELMATGKVTINENNLALTVDYGVPESRTAYTIDLNTEADITSQIQAIVDDALDHGITINGMLTSKKVIAKIRNNARLQTAINGNVGAGAQLSTSAVENYFSDEFGIDTIITNDLTYGESASIGEDGRPVIAQSRYYPQNKITFFATNPGGKLGTGLWGDSPEADAAGFYDVGGSTVSPYVYIMQWMETDPAVLWTKASGLFMPVLYNPDSLFIATVADDFMDPATIAPENQGNSVFDVPVSSLQASDVAVANGAVTGTIKYLSGSNAITNVWGPGNFLCLKWSDIDPKANSIKVGLEPSAGTGLVECFNDPDRNGIFKITNKNVQKFKIVVSNGEHSRVQTLDLSGLTLQTS
ncbi:MAG: major capsid protein [Lachnospiraceae bacterium]|nr:major capsid protein [Lachnospiraceae bacterium]